MHVGKHENLLQTDTMILMGMVKHSQSYQNSKFAMYLKKLRDEVDFSHADKHQSGLQVHFNTLGTKASSKVILSLLRNMISILKSLQYLRKEVRNAVHFLHAHRNQSLEKLALSFLTETDRYVKNVQNRKLVTSLQYIKKKVYIRTYGLYI